MRRLCLALLLIAPACTDRSGADDDAGGSTDAALAADGAPAADAAPTLGTPVILGVDRTSLAPGSRLTVMGTDFQPAADVVLIFGDGTGFELEVPAIEVHDASAVVIVPPWVDGQTGLIGPGTVQARVRQILDGETAESNLSEDLDIGDLPPTALMPGELTSAWLRALAAIMEAFRLRLVFMADATEGRLDTASMVTWAVTMRDEFTALADDVDVVVADPAQTIDSGTIGGMPLLIDAQALELVDRLVGAAVMEQMGALAPTTIDPSVSGHVGSWGNAAWLSCTPDMLANGDWLNALADIAREMGNYMGYAGVLFAVAAAVAGAPVGVAAAGGAIVWAAGTFPPAAMGLYLDMAAGAAHTGGNDYTVFGPTISFLAGKYWDIATSGFRTDLLASAGLSGPVGILADQAIGPAFDGIKNALTGLLDDWLGRADAGEPLYCQPDPTYCEGIVSFQLCGFGPLVTCGDGECVRCCEDDVLCAPYSCECGPPGSWGVCN